MELTRLYATEDAISDGINFYELSDFSLVICKPDRKVIYSGCEWSDIQEEGQLNAMVAEKVTVVASNELRPRHGPWDELRPPTAGRLLYLWRASRDAAEEPMERSLLCNARVLAESCFYQGEPVFRDGEAVLELLTHTEMEGVAAPPFLRHSSGAGGGEPGI